MGHKFRNQNLKVDLYIPVNQIIYLDNSTRSFLHDVENIQDLYDRDMPNHYYIMTKEGLSCMDCEREDWESSREESNSFKMNIDENGVNINVTGDDNENAEVIIDKNGVKVTSSNDSIQN